MSSVFGFEMPDLGFELPDESGILTDKEYMNLVNRIRGNFLSYASVLDHALALIITDFFLRDKGSQELWAETVFDEDRAASFGAKIVWLPQIIKSHPKYQERIDRETRTRIQQELDEIRKTRNDFAHKFARNRRIDAEDVKARRIRLYEFENDQNVSKTFEMSEIMRIINDTWVWDRLCEIEEITKEIRGGPVGQTPA